MGNRMSGHLLSSLLVGFKDFGAGDAAEDMPSAKRSCGRLLSGRGWLRVPLYLPLLVPSPPSTALTPTPQGVISP